MGDSTLVPPGVSCSFHPYHILLDGYNADIEEKRNRSTHRKLSECIGLEREESPHGGGHDMRCITLRRPPAIRYIVF